MRLFSKLFFVATITGAALFLIGCSPTIPVRVEQPWTRIIDSDNPIPEGAKVTVEAVGNTMPLPGDEGLFQKKLQYFVEDLLMRRGFEISEDESLFTVRLAYNTYRPQQKMWDPIYTIKPLISHSISLEIYDSEDFQIWRGDSTWESFELDGLKDFGTPIHLLISKLPHIEGHWPMVLRVKPDRWYTYFNLYCKYGVFSSPALPYRIKFNDTYNNSSHDAFDEIIFNKHALHAYHDLLLNAEFVVPTGSDSYINNDHEIINVRNPKLWTKATLGGMYFIGNTEEATPVMIWLKATESAYIVQKCAVVDEAEYNRFINRQNRWQEAKMKYYDLFE